MRTEGALENPRLGRVLGHASVFDNVSKWIRDVQWPQEDNHFKLTSVVSRPPTPRPAASPSFAANTPQSFRDFQAGLEERTKNAQDRLHRPESSLDGPHTEEPIQGLDAQCVSPNDPPFEEWSDNDSENSSSDRDTSTMDEEI